MGFLSGAAPTANAVNPSLAYPNQMADPFNAALMSGQVVNAAPIGAGIAGGPMAERLPMAAAELAKLMPAPQGNLMQMMAMMKAIQMPEDPFDKELALAKLNAGAHQVRPPVSGGGGSTTVGLPAYQMKMGAGAEGPKSLGDYLRGTR